MWWYSISDLTSVVRVGDIESLGSSLRSTLLALVHCPTALLISPSQHQDVLHPKGEAMKLKEGGEQTTKSTQKKISYSSTIELQ